VKKKSGFSSLCFFKCNLYRYASDIPLAMLKKAGGGGGGFKIPKKEGGATPSKAEKLAAKEELGQ
jgi:hypothetical protein